MGYTRRRIAPAISVITFLSLLPTFAAKGIASPSPSTNWVVILPVANVYSSATENTDVVSHAILGSNVAVLERRHK